MKIVAILVLLIVCCLFGCNSRNISETTLDFIPGVYITNYQSEFSRTRDTLELKLLPHKHGRQFSIVRRSYHEYRLERKRAPDYKIDHWTASYAERENVLLVHKNGRTLSFDPDQKLLIMGAKHYKKL